jgi:hypothetical protein
VLDATQAKLWEEYQKLGTPEAIAKVTAERDEAKGKLATHERNEVIRGAAEAHGYKASALAKLPSLQGKEIVIRDVTVDGKTEKRAYVGEQPLPDYIQANDADFLPALAVTPPSGTNQQRQNGGTTFVPQGGGPNPPRDLVAEAIAAQQKARDEASNPLKR